MDTDAPIYACNPTDPSQGFYVIEQDGEQFRYVWTEGVGNEPDRGRQFPTRSQALRDAADNWDEAGSGGRLSATLRAAATRAEKMNKSNTVIAEIASLPHEPAAVLIDEPVRRNAELIELPRRKYAYMPTDLRLGFYAIEQNEAGTQFRYVWTDEVDATPAEHGRWFGSLSRALRDAADNWDEAGSGGRLSATLRAAATRAEKKEKSS